MGEGGIRSKSCQGTKRRKRGREEREKGKKAQEEGGEAKSSKGRKEVGGKPD